MFWVCGSVVVWAQFECKVSEMICRDVHRDVDVLSGPVRPHNDSIGVATSDLVKTRPRIPGVTTNAAFPRLSAVLMLEREGAIEITQEKIFFSISA